MEQILGGVTDNSQCRHSQPALITAPTRPQQRTIASDRLFQKATTGNKNENMFIRCKWLAE